MLEDEEITIAVIERELGLRVPGFVAEAIDRFASIDSDSWCCLITPRRLLCRNLEQRFQEGLRRTSFREPMIVIGDDGCGNFFLVDTSDDDAFRMWNHEVDRIDDPDCSFADYVDSEIASLTPPDGEPFRWIDRDYVVLHRTRDWREAALAPIQLDQWREAVAQVSCTRLAERKTMVNPFTKEETHVELPGRVALASDAEQPVVLQLFEGRVTCDNVSDAVTTAFAELAEALGCRVTRVHAAT